MTEPRNHRRSIRLQDWDYTAAGAYFITICTQGHALLFGDVVGDTVRLNECGDTVWACWNQIPNHFPQAEMDACVVMPNHVHGIIVMTARTPDMAVGTQYVGAQHAAPLHIAPGSAPLPRRPGVQPGSLGAIVRSFKSATTQRINARRGVPGAPMWQRNYYEHIIRNDQSLQRIREYIKNNPARWAEDPENPDTVIPPGQGSQHVRVR